MKSKQSDRRGFLKGSAALAGLVAGATQSAKAQPPDSFLKPRGTSKEQIAYGERSKYVTSKREPAPGRASPDAFGLAFHIGTPLQEQVGNLTPSALHYFATHRGAFVPDIDPKEHRLLVHGMVDRPLSFTMDDLRRFPSVTRQHFIECAGNRARLTSKTVQESHGLTSNTEWTGVPLSVLLKECGVQSSGSWVVAEGAEEVKGASSIPMGKAMDDCLVAYGQMGEPIRPHNGFPLRLMVPGYEGIFQVKYLRRIKVVDRYYWTYNDYGHLRREARDAALSTIWGPKSIITAPSGSQKIAPGMHEIRGLAWSGQGAVKTVEISTDGGKTWKAAQLKGTAHKMAHVAFGMSWNWDGKECEITSRCTDDQGSIQPTLAQVAAYWKEPMKGNDYRLKGLDNSIFGWKIAGDGSVTNGRA